MILERVLTAVVKIQRRWRGGVWLLTLAASVSCGGNATAPAAPSATVSSLAVTAATPLTGIGQQVQLLATATLSNGTTQNVTALATWQSSNAGVLSVSATGLATSIAEGEARVSATYQTATGTTDLVVRVQWSVQGRVVGNPGGEGVSGAAITVDGVATMSGADGTYTIQGPGTPGRKSITVSTPGYLTRGTAVSVNGARTGVSLDVIALASPFSLQFYRELLRGAADNPSSPLLPVLRWEVSPSFYIRTSNGSAEMPQSVISELAGLIPSIVAEATGGRLAVLRIEAGSENRPITPGWINVEYTTEISSCGTGTVGGGLARINPICSCLGTVGIHEITHVLGYWHHSQPGGLMSRVAPSSCSRGLNSLEAYHARIAYARPRGNTDPDNDPQSFTQAFPAIPPADRTLACWPVK